MKKMMLLAVIAIAFLATARTRIGGPLPECDPCPWVR